MYMMATAEPADMQKDDVPQSKTAYNNPTEAARFKAELD